MATNLRAPLAGVSALLVVSLFLGASLQAKPAIRETSREGATERVAVRQLTVSLARAVRHLVGSDHHRPCVQTTCPLGVEFESRGLPGPAAMAQTIPAPPMLRAGLLDLPPPALLS